MATKRTKHAYHNATPLETKSEAQLKREARARLRRLDPTTAVELANNVVGKPVTGSVLGFVTFLREHAIVGLAVGFVLGTQVQTVVKAFISGFVDPLFMLIVPGNKALSARTFTLHFNGRHADFGWGGVAYAVLDFLVIAGTIYFVIRIFQLDKLDIQKK